MNASRGYLWAGLAITICLFRAESLSATVVSYWDLDEAASGTAAALDPFGGNNGTFTGTATRTAGLVGLGAAQFNNAGGDAVDVGSGAGSFSFSSGLALEALIRPTWSGASMDYDEIFRKEDGGNRILLSFQNDSYFGGAQIPVAPGPVLSFGLNTGGYGELDMPLNVNLSALPGGNPGSGTIYLDAPGGTLGSGDVVLKDGAAHHVAATYDQATGRKALWIDGVERWSFNVAGNPAIVSGGGVPAYIGNSSGGGEPFTGVIDEVAIHNAALDAAAVARHFAKSEAGLGYFDAQPSKLIGTVDYSDSFTLTAYGGIAGRTANTYPIHLPGINVEDNHGNTARVWTDSMWSISSDAAVINGGTLYPGGSDNGSLTGMTQRGGGGGDWGIEYGLRSDFVVQTDFVQTTDRIDVIAGAARDTIGNAGNLSVFFRQTGHPLYPEIGIYNPAIGERNSGLTSGIPSAGQWHNYAVRFDQNNKELWVYVDENLRGVVHLNTFEGGAFAALTSNAAVSVGYAGGDRGWSDNFMVGSADKLTQVAWEIQTGTGSGPFKPFRTITGPSDRDFADVHSGNGVTFTLVPGFDSLHSAGAQDTLDLNDGVAVEAPANSDTFLPADGAEVRVLIDLHGSQVISDINTFGTTTTDPVRAYQNYRLYGADTSSLLPTTGADPLADGWTLIADVSHREITLQSEHGINISNINERFNRLLWILTPYPGDARSAHYVEFDIYTIPEPSTLALAGLGVAAMLGFGWRRRRKLVQKGNGG